MKKLTALLAVLAAVLTASADTSITVTTAQDVSIVLNPNGSLTGTPSWSMTGVGGLVPAGDARSARLVTAGAGTNVVTVTAPSAGGTLVSKVTVIVMAPPATDLGVTASAVSK